MKVLITGHKGYIGSTVFELLSSRPELKVDGLDFAPQPGFESGRFDIVNAFGMEYDVLVHLAAYTSVPNSFEESSEYYSNNCNKYHEFLNLNNNKFGKVIYSSSISIFEGDTIDPKSVYSSTKLEGEFITRRYTDNHFIMRFANPIGVTPSLHKTLPNLQNYDNVLWRLAKCKLNNETFKIHNFPRMTRDFFPLSMIANTILDAIRNDSTGTHFVRSNVNTPVMALLIYICDEFRISYDFVQPPAGTSIGLDTSNSQLELDDTILKYCVSQLHNYIECLK